MYDTASKFKFFTYLSNYSFCKVRDQFLASKQGFFDPIDLDLLTLIVKYLQEPIDSNLVKPIRCKTFLAYLLTNIGQYLYQRSTDILKAIHLTLNNSNAKRAVDLTMLTQFNKCLTKKVCFLNLKFILYIR